MTCLDKPRAKVSRTSSTSAQDKKETLLSCHVEGNPEPQVGYVTCHVKGNPEPQVG